MQFIYLLFIIVGLIAVVGIIFLVHVITHRSGGGITFDVDMGISSIANYFATTISNTL